MTFNLLPTPEAHFWAGTLVGFLLGVYMMWLSRPPKQDPFGSKTVQCTTCNRVVFEGSCPHCRHYNRRQSRG